MDTNVKQRFINLLQDESGKDLVEYAFLAVVIALWSVAAMNSISSGVVKVFTALETKLTVSA